MIDCSEEDLVSKETYEEMNLIKYKGKENHYLFNVESLNNNKKRKNYKDYEPFSFLDIDPKLQIKSYQGFNYLICNKTTQSPQNFYLDAKFSKKGSKKDKQLSREETKNVKKEKMVEKPKYDLKFTFELEANDINLINEFVDPDPKYLQNSEYLQTDYFLNMEISQENYNKIFDPLMEEDKKLIEHYCNNDSNDFLLDYQSRLNNTSPKKHDMKLRELNDLDYLVYVVDEKQFYKKMIVTEKSFNTVKQDDSPKVRVKVKKLPIKIFDDHL